MRDEALLFCRFIAIVAMTIWLGGFMFYGGLVVPILDDALGSYEAGMITRQVTNRLNVVGVVTVSWWFLLARVERRRGSRWVSASRLGLLIVTTLGLVALAVLHVIMDGVLDSRELRGFRSWHRLYLMVSTGQWLANLAILGTSLRIWTAIGEGKPRYPDPH
jgi:hypothetical protein